MDLWNQKHLPAPPTNTYKSKSKDLDLVKLRNALQDCIRHFKNEDFMIREAALLSRILYRMKMKFRSSKEFKSMEKISHSLNIYLNANMGRDLKNVFDLIPSKYQLETYLPTKNMLNYILVRIQGLVKLMERLYDTCQIAAYEINTRISIGHFWRNYVILFALVSRIYVLVKFNAKLLCELYGKILPHSSKLENTGRNWLPEGYELPSDLREWLGVDWVYEEDFIDLTQDLSLNNSVKILDFFNLVDDDDDDDEVQFCDEYVLIDEEDRNIARDFRKFTPIKETFTRNRMRGFSINEDDIGEDIADIIKLNETTTEDINVKYSEKDKEKELRLSHVNKTLDVDDIGEEISSTENNDNNQIQIINLDETIEYHLNVDRTMKRTEINSNLIKSPKKGTSKSPKPNKRSRIKTTKNDTVIDLSADATMVINKTEVIVVPETPLKSIGDKLQDNSLLILDDNLNISNRKNNLELSATFSKGDKKKKKDTSMVREKDKLSLTNQNFSENPVHLSADDTMGTNETEVIVIPETPLKSIRDQLQDNSVLILDNTINDNLKISNRKNNLELSARFSKSDKKKKKDTSKAKEKEKLSLTNQNFSKNPVHLSADHTMGTNETEVIVIPETPLKSIGDKLQDNSLLILDDNLNISNRKNNLELSATFSKGDKKKKKDTSMVREKDKLSLTNQNFSENPVHLSADDTMGTNETEVKVIPETPLKSIRDQLQDNSVLILDNTINDNLKISNRKNNLELSARFSKSDKKKKKDTSKAKEKEKLSLTNQNFSKNPVHLSADHTMGTNETEVIVIPETPLKSIGDQLQDNSVLILDNTINDNLKISNRKNNLELSATFSKSDKKKKKDTSKAKEKEKLSLKNHNFSENPVHHNKTSRILDCTENNSSLKDVNSPIPNIFLNEKEIKTEKETLNEFNNNGVLNEIKSEKEMPKCEEMHPIENGTTIINNSNNLTSGDALTQSKKGIKENTLEKLDDKSKIGENYLIAEIKTEPNIEVKEETNVSTENIKRTLNDSQSLTPQNRKITEENALEQKISIKIETKASFPSYKLYVADRRRRRQRGEEVSPLRKDDTNSKKQDKNKIEVPTAKISRAEKLRRRKQIEIEKKKQKEMEEERQRKEHRGFNSVLDKIGSFLRGEPQEVYVHKKKKKKGGSREKKKDEPSLDNKNTNIVRLTLVKDIPKVEHINQKKDNALPNNCGEDKSSKKMKLIPSLETPIRATLNIDKLRASRNGGTSEENIHNISLERSENDKLKFELEQRRKFRKSFSNRSLSMNKFQEETSKKMVLDKPPSNFLVDMPKNEGFKSSKDKKQIETSLSNILMERTEKEKIKEGQNKKEKLKESPSKISVKMPENYFKRKNKEFKKKRLFEESSMSLEMEEVKGESKKQRLEVSHSTLVETPKNKELKKNHVELERKKCQNRKFEESYRLREMSKKGKSEEKSQNEKIKESLSSMSEHEPKITDLRKKSEQVEKKKGKKLKFKESLSDMSLEMSSEKEESTEEWRKEVLEESLPSMSVETPKNNEINKNDEVKMKQDRKRKFQEAMSNISTEKLENEDFKKNRFKKKLIEKSPSNMLVEMPKNKVRKKDEKAEKRNGKMGKIKELLSSIVNQQRESDYKEESMSLLRKDKKPKKKKNKPSKKKREALKNRHKT